MKIKASKPTLKLVANILKDSEKNILATINNRHITSKRFLKQQIVLTKRALKGPRFDNKPLNRQIAKDELNEMCLLAAFIFSSEEELAWAYNKAPVQSTARAMIATLLLDIKG